MRRDDPTRERAVRVRDDVRVRISLEDPDPPTGADHASQLRDGASALRDMGQAGDSQDRVELSLTEWELSRIAFAQLDPVAEASLVGQLAGDVQEGRTGIEADDHAVGSDSPRQVPQHDPAATADLEHALARPNVEQVEVRFPSRNL